MLGRRVSPDFVGRTDELAALAAAYEEALTSGPTLALVAGEAGIGKTRLVSEFTSNLKGDPLVLTGGCLELADDGLPYAPFISVVRGLVRAVGRDRVIELLPGRVRSLSRWLPELGDGAAGAHAAESEPEQGRARLFTEILTLVEGAAVDRPVVCVVEDLHWADASSRELLIFLVRNLADAQFLLIGTYRDSEMDWPQLHRAPRVHLVEPQPFNPAEVRQQLASILGREPEPPLVSRIFARSDGNPLFVESLVDAGDTTPTTLRDMLLGGLAEMPDRTRRVLRAAAVAGSEFSHELLVAVTGLDDAELDRALRQVVDRHLLVPSDAGYAFRHALIRSAVYDDLLPGERARLHARCAEALLADASLVPDGRAPAELAVHWNAAGAYDRALEAAWRAADVAAHAYAYDERARLLDRVLELWDRVPDAEARLGIDHAGALERAASACFASGDAEHGLSLATAALDELDPELEPERTALVLYTRSWLLTRIHAGGEEDLEAALRLLPDDRTNVLRGKMLVSLAGHYLSLCEAEPAREYANEALAIAHATGDPGLLPYALTDVAMVTGLSGDVEMALKQFHEAQDAARRVGDDYILLTAMLWEASVLGITGDHDAAGNVAREGVAEAYRVGLLRNRGTSLAFNLVWSLLEAGRWDEAEELIRDTLAIVPPPMYRGTLMLYQAKLALFRGDLAGVAEAMVAVDAVAEEGPSAAVFLFDRWEVHAGVALAQGDAEAADRVVGRAFDEYQWGGFDVDALRVLIVGARAQRLRRAAAPVVAARRSELRSIFERVTVRGPLAEAHAATFLAELGEGGGGGLAAWDAAATKWRSLRKPYPLACVLVPAAEAALAAGGRGGAEERLREAAAIARRLSAEPLVRQIESLAARGRLAVGADEPVAGTPDVGAELGLTAREVEVLRLIAEGRSNRQIGAELFISPNTAGVHVSNILMKLGVASRTEAAAVAHRAGLLDDPA